MTFEFWDLILQPRLLLMLVLVVAFFLPLLISIKKTWDARGKIEGSNLE